MVILTVDLYIFHYSHVQVWEVFDVPLPPGEPEGRGDKTC